METLGPTHSSGNTRVHGLNSKVHGLNSKVHGLNSKVHGLNSKVYGWNSKVLSWVELKGTIMGGTQRGVREGVQREALE